MSEDLRNDSTVDRFILEEIETVPHLEALLLFYRGRPQAWTLEKMSNALYLDAKWTQGILEDLARRGLIVGSQEHQEWRYAQNQNRDILMDRVDRSYQAELIRITRMIHAKQSNPIREFSKAFQFKKSGG